MRTLLHRLRRGSFEARPIESFPRVAGRIRDLVPALGLEGIPPATYVLYGSFVRALFTREAWSDVNLAFTTSAALREHGAAAAGLPCVAVRPRPASVTRLLREADFGIGQIALHAGRLHHHPAALEHTARRVLVYRPRGAVPPEVTLLRSYKFVRRGYALPEGELVRIIRRISRRRISFAEPTLAHHSGGVFVAE
jgi:hypothetical protein